LLQVINDILDFSKIEAGKLELVNATFDLSDQVSQLERMFRPNATQKGLDLFCKISSNVPQMLIGDQYRLQQILSNLLSNAVKFTTQGSILLEASLVQEAKIGSGILVQLEFRVKDTGVGIPKEQQAHIFESFTQLENFATRSQGGTGLGLAICSRLATLMGGSITLTSETGEGSIFTVHLPFFVGDEKHLKALAPQSGDYSSRLPREILLADDDEMNRMVVSTLLRTEGHRVTTVEDGEGLLVQLAKRRFDIVLTDISMPGLEGSKVAEIIRSGQREGIASDIPIIAMTAHAFPQDRERFLASGINGYVSKPINYEELLQLIDNLCGAASGNDLPVVQAIAVTDGGPSAAPADETLDIDYLRRNYSGPGMDEMMRYAANLFLKRSQEIGTQLAAAVAANDIAEVKHLAHKFFGVAGTVGARQVGRLVREIEYAAIDQQMPTVIKLLEGLDSDLEKAVEAVSRYAGI
jgi:CheY-like chemotaxis protein/HPt (histidine-containing phosphotransfer) domain-containing protein